MLPSLGSQSADDAIAWLLLLPLLPLYWIAGVIIDNAFFHPLAGVPGPTLAAVSNVWQAYQVRNGRMLQLSKSLHQTYGPVVRVGPNDVWFNSKEAFKTIYASGSGFEKSLFYLATILRVPSIRWWPPCGLAYHDTLDLLSEPDMARYRLQRRLIGPTYHASQVKKYERAIESVIERAITQITSLNGEEVDLKEWMHIIVVECLAAVVLSSSTGYLRDKTDHGCGAHSYLSWRRKSVVGLFPSLCLTEVFSSVPMRVFSKLWGIRWQPPQGFKPFFPTVSGKISRRISAALREKPPVDTRIDLLADLILLHKTKPDFTENYLRRMAMTNFGAGHETTTSALTAAVAMIGSHVEVQSRIVDEICSQRGVDAAVGYDATASLPYTTASIKEAQRLHPATAMSLPRIVPADGVRIDGYFFPAGTTVGCNATSLHRNPDIFGHEPEAFRPDRWLDCDTDTRRAMERLNLTWGGGARTCPGRNLAELILHKVAPALIRAFEIHTTVPPEDEMPHYFMAMLTGVKVRFLERQTRCEPGQVAPAE